MSRLEYEGRFLADIEDFGIFQSKHSQALAVDIHFTTISYFQGETQTEYPGYGTRGRFFVVGKTGDILQEQVAALADATGWDGDLSVILQETWQPRSPVQIIVHKEKTDKDRTYFNAVRILRADWQPARAGNVNEEDGRRIAARYTSALKSVVSKYRRQQAEEPVDSSPPSAPAPPSAPTPPSTPAPPATPVSPPTDSSPAQASPLVEWTPENVWEAFQSRAGDMSRKDVESVWNEAIRYFAEGKALSELTQEELAQIGSIDPQSWTPF